MKPRVLLTNDDGAAAPGLRALADALEESFEVIVVAPSREWSTTSHTLTLMKPIEVHEVAPNRYVVEGTPTDCVHLALKEMIKPGPDIVISGINRGANMGEDISYSGTVAAAMEACLCGAKSFAVSVIDWMNPQYDAAAAFAARLAGRLIRKNIPPRTFFNVNVPSGLPEKINKSRWTRLGNRVYPLDVQPVDPATVGSKNSSRFYSIGGVNLDFKDTPGTDFHAVHRGKISITPLHLDLTCYPLMPRLRKWVLD